MIKMKCLRRFGGDRASNHHDAERIEVHMAIPQRMIRGLCKQIFYSTALRYDDVDTATRFS